MKIFVGQAARILPVATMLGGLVLFPVTKGWAQQKGAEERQQIVGIWKLVSSVNTNPNLPKFASGNRAQGTAEENKAVVKGSIGSFGTYSVSPDGKILTIKQEGGTWALRNGMEEKRALALSGDDLKYTTAATVGGTSELVYKRVK